MNWRLLAGVRSTVRLRTRLRRLWYAWQYQRALSPAATHKFRRSRCADVAVAVHLFHVDTWPLIRDSLESLPPRSFDLFVTMPRTNRPFEPRLREGFPDVRVVYVPNLGRDVLPFLRLSRSLIAAGYESVLKLHSKKSTAYTDGPAWLRRMLDQLVPSDAELLESIIQLLRDPRTALIGPAGMYWALPFYFEHNAPHLERVLARVFDAVAAQHVLAQRGRDLGFFGGTMFWARLDAVRPLLEIGCHEFEFEHGQHDGTMAHAVERLFGVVPALNGLTLYEVSDTAVAWRPTGTSDVPPWGRNEVV